MIYKLMPRARIAWRDVWIGAAVTALLFEIGKLLIGLYLGKASVASGFGAAGSLVVVLVWVYFAAQIFLLGAEFTWAYAHECGSKAEQSGQRSGPIVQRFSDSAPTTSSPQAPASAVTLGTTTGKETIVDRGAT